MSTELMLNIITFFTVIIPLTAVFFGVLQFRKYRKNNPDPGFPDTWVVNLHHLLFGLSVINFVFAVFPTERSPYAGLSALIVCMLLACITVIMGALNLIRKPVRRRIFLTLGWVITLSIVVPYVYNVVKLFYGEG